ncbi:MAG: hypothetical protein HYS81_04725 [Candidatus Aenigmatarchaeota archaeon]|nr:MAG: hypothetical protein HYS81_04725 [Candidatus Aenigmarchaeota archaeon]
MLYVTACYAGVFALDKDFNVAAFSLFPRDAATIKERLHVLRKGVTTPELDEVLATAKDKALVTDLGFEYEGFEITREPGNPGAQYAASNVRKLAVETGFVKDQQELNALLSELARLETKEKLKAKPNKDKIVAQAVASIEDLTEIANVMSERLHEWYGIYHPELERKTRDNEKYAQAIVDGAKREEDTIGTYIEEDDLEQIRLHAAETVDLFGLKRDYEMYLERAMPGVAPNTTAVAGPILAAKMIKHAGSLERLAKMPASTIQLLGAEKALFRFMKSRKQGARDARPPKYGLLFTHPYIQHAPQEKRGKVARALAAKISMAAKTDFYSKEDRSETYKTDLEKKVKEIMAEK